VVRHAEQSTAPAVPQETQRGGKSRSSRRWLRLALALISDSHLVRYAQS
jgi:hypothetical protein